MRPSRRDDDNCASAQARAIIPEPLQKQGEGYLHDDYFTNVYFVPLADAFKQITGDAMGVALHLIVKMGKWLLERFSQG
ncbi:MAG: hypothetical protein JO069_11150 [Verrucomicrobia bacterium]|nr:hypothetical protein [Verrucomicrobiota bacterium]